MRRIYLLMLLLSSLLCAKAAFAEGCTESGWHLAECTLMSDRFFDLVNKQDQYSVDMVFMYEGFVEGVAVTTMGKDWCAVDDLMKKATL